MSDLLTPEQAAELMSRSVLTLQDMRTKGGGPKYVKLGHRTIRYRREDIEAWINARVFSNTAEASKR